MKLPCYCASNATSVLARSVDWYWLGESGLQCKWISVWEEIDQQRTLLKRSVTTDHRATDNAYTMLVSHWLHSQRMLLISHWLQSTHARLSLAAVNAWLHCIGWIVNGSSFIGYNMRLIFYDSLKIFNWWTVLNYLTRTEKDVTTWQWVRGMKKVELGDLERERELRRLKAKVR